MYQAPWTKYVGVSLATSGAGGTEVVPAGRWWVGTIVVHNLTGTGRVVEIHDHATATEAAPMRVAVPGNGTVAIPGVMSFENGVRAAAPVADVNLGLTVWAHRRFP